MPGSNCARHQREEIDTSRLAGLVVCMLVFSLSGCGEQDETAVKTPTGSGVPDDNVFKDQVRALEKAGEVQKTLDEASVRQRELIEEPTQ